MVKKQWYNLRFVQMGLSFGISFMLFSFLGAWAGKALDQRLGSEPWIMIIGMFLGAIFAFYSLIMEILASDKFINGKSQDEKQKKP